VLRKEVLQTKDLSAISQRALRKKANFRKALVVVALGITWVLDGLEVTLAGAVAGALKESSALRLSNADIGLAGSAYIAGAVLGAVFFGWLTDRLGRKRLFFITLAVYSLATAATALSWDIWSFMAFRFLTGAGIGGEYVAINSTIQELVPARVRGWTDLAINGSFWVGAALGAAGSIVLLDPSYFGPDVGWRLAAGVARCKNNSRWPTMLRKSPKNLTSYVSVQHRLLSRLVTYGATYDLGQTSLSTAERRVCTNDAGRSAVLRLGCKHDER
jgi:predicted MFS family arabinose efflux permease